MTIGNAVMTFLSSLYLKLRDRPATYQVFRIIDPDLPKVSTYGPKFYMLIISIHRWRVKLRAPVQARYALRTRSESRSSSAAWEKRICPCDSAYAQPANSRARGRGWAHRGGAALAHP